MRIRRNRQAAREDLLALASQLAAIDRRQARVLAELCAGGRAAERARARVLRPETEDVVDLLAALERLAADFPLSRRTPEGAAAFTAAADLLIATHGRRCLTPAQRLTLSRAAVHALDPMEA